MGTTASPPRRPPALTTPAEARAAFRAGRAEPTAGWSAGRAQANLIAVPEDWAYDVLLFAQRNRLPCPVLDVTDPGVATTSLAPGADLRTDLPRYRVWRDGRLVAEPTEVTGLWRDDLVAFLIGCSFTFESALLEAGVPLRHIEQGRNVSMYVTDRPCRPSGRLHGPLVVSMRPIPAALVETARRLTSRMPAVHGAPVRCGDPAGLGIADLGRPDFGDPVVAHPGDVPVFWACGVTPQASLMASDPPFAITHAPGHMFITDVPDSAYRLP
ncbi:putative hydro-lyase [Streptomyces sp. ISL-11]|uniref:putative hydro-lyase n=1 Tax=Streptomyces sp. ISL-11 TaxID=2819174 RepID=UPI001BE79665|nr:putative hydro-lyase [Streptomyces sp. ISL-11]MBT2384937.1 putative hydro-lyase [Streptomyces sp. ISL-11]